MKYAKITGGVVEFYPSSLDYLVSQGVLQSASPTAEEMSAAGVVEIANLSSNRPNNEFNYDTKPVQQADGSWKEEWVQVETSNEQKQVNISRIAASVVCSRNDLLKLSDWTQLPDCPISNKREWAVYRQALRDITSQSGFPFVVNWPTQP